MSDRQPDIPLDVASLPSWILDGLEDEVVIHDVDGRPVYANQPVLVRLDLTRDDFRTLPPFGWFAEPQILAERMESITSTGHARFEVEHPGLDGRIRHFEAHSTMVYAEGVPLVVSIVRDVSERRRGQEAFERLAFYDVLTGLPNRRLFMDRLERAVAHDKRAGERSALLFVDIDDLKTVNDGLGHKAGDEMLVRTAELLQKMVREEDTVARLAGDEFVILVRGVSGVEAAERIATKICHALRRPMRIGSHRLTANASIGVALGTQESTPADLLRQADTAMYEVKRSTGDGCRVYEPAMGKRAVKRLQEFEELREGFEQGQLMLHYQPQVSIPDRSVVALEALLRWDHPTRGVLPAGDFIDVAEESGLIVQIGSWVIAEACRQLAAWRCAGLDRLRVAINVSQRQFLDDDIVQVVQWALEQSDVPADRLELEITESLAAEDSQAVYDVLHRLREMGVRIAVDDFGTGYSSLNHIRRFPVNALKVDREFIEHLETDDVSMSLTRTIIELGEALGLDVVAEGVENERQAALLETTGCRNMQGFLFAPALSPEELVPMLHRVLDAL